MDIKAPVSSGITIIAVFLINEDHSSVVSYEQTLVLITKEGIIWKFPPLVVFAGHVYIFISSEHPDSR